MLALNILNLEIYMKRQILNVYVVLFTIIEFSVVINNIKVKFTKSDQQTETCFHQVQFK